jgi:hypothetical protein
MAKKSFRGTGAGIDGILGIKPSSSELEMNVLENQQTGRPEPDNDRQGPIGKTGRKRVSESLRKSQPSDGVRSTMIFNLDKLEKLRALAYWERQPIKCVLEDALDKYFESKGEAYVDYALKDWKDNQRG